MQWQLFQAGSIRANVRVQNARQEQALDAYQQTVLSALEDAENALTAYAREQTRRESLSQSVQANGQALELSTQLYNNGLADFLHVLDSERSLYAAQDALVQSDQTVSLNLVQLYKALGGGWENETNAIPSRAAGRFSGGVESADAVVAPAIDQELARLTKDLELTPKQQQQVRPLLQEHHDKIQTLLDKNPKSSRQELAPQIHAISDETHHEIHALLTDHQQELEKAMQQREHNGEENRQSAQ